MKPLAIATAADDCPQQAFRNWGLPLNSGKLAGIRQYSNEDATDNELISNYFAQIEGRPSILEN